MALYQPATQQAGRPRFGRLVVGAPRRLVVVSVLMLSAACGPGSPTSTATLSPTAAPPATATLTPTDPDGVGLVIASGAIHSLAWSSDSQTLSYSVGAQAWAYSLATGVTVAVTQVTPTLLPQPSLAGQPRDPLRVSFSPSQRFFIALVGSASASTPAPTAATPVDGEVRSGGAWVDVYVSSAAGVSHLGRLPNCPYEFQWSHTEALVFASTSAMDACSTRAQVIDLAAGTSTELFAPADLAGDLKFLDFAPDDTQLLVRTPLGVAVMDLATGSVTPLAFEPTAIRAKWLAADQLLVVYRSQLIDAVRLGLYDLARGTWQEVGFRGSPVLTSDAILLTELTSPDRRHVAVVTSNALYSTSGRLWVAALP